MERQTRNRKFWEKAVADAERHEGPHREVAKRYGVSESALKNWIYKIRHEQGESTKVLPVEVSGSEGGLRIRRGGVELTLDPGWDPEAVARLVSALSS